MTWMGNGFLKLQRAAPELEGTHYQVPIEIL